MYCHSPSYRCSEHIKNPNKFFIENDELNYNYSNEKRKINNKNVYTKQIFSKYNLNSKSKKKDKLNKYKINVDNINKLVNFEDDLINKKCIYNIPNSISNNNVFQQNNYFTTNNYFNCSSKRLESSKDCSPKIYVKPTKKRNNQSNIYLNHSPKIQHLSPKINTFYSTNEDNTSDYKEKHSKIFKFAIGYDKYRTKGYAKNSTEISNNNIEKKNDEFLHNIRTKVINNNIRCKKYYDYILKIKPIFKPICYFTKIVIKTKYIPKCKRSFITKISYGIIKKPISLICFISKNNLNIKNNNTSNHQMKNKEQDIIKANILDFSVEQNKEKIINNNQNHNRIIKYIGNEKNYQESFGEINLSFSSEEINSFRQKESTIEAVFSELVNINSFLMNTESESKITFCPNLRNNNFGNCNNYETTTFGRMINNSSNYAETDRTEKIERTSYKRDEIIKEFKENINVNLPLKLGEIKCYENSILNTERVHLNRNNDKKIKGMINSKDIINFTETLGNIFNKKKNMTKSLNNTEEKSPKFRTYPPKKKKINKDFEVINQNNINPNKRNKFDINNISEQNDYSYNNITFNTNKNNNNEIKSDIIYLLNIITINNFIEVKRKILKIIIEENQGIYIFSEILTRKFDNEIKFNILYTFFGKNLLSELKGKEVNEMIQSKILNICSKYDNYNKLNIYEKDVFNLYKNILTNKNNNIKEHNFNYYYLNDCGIINKELLSMIKQDLFNFNISNNIITYSRYKSKEIHEIIESYIEICIDNTIDNKLKISNCNNYIYKILEYFALNTNIKKKKQNIIRIILDIDNIVVENKDMFDIIGYLLYCLIKFEALTIGDFDSFLKKDEFAIIYLAKTLKYTFSYGDEKNNQLWSNFKKSKLFKKYSDIFHELITLDEN